MTKMRVCGGAPGTFAAGLHGACAACDVGAAEAYVSAARPAKRDVQQSVDAPSFDMCTPLHVATAKGSAEIVRILLDSGADPNATHPEMDGWTPLHIACKMNNYLLVELLLEGGASTKKVDWYGSRPEDLGDARIKSTLQTWQKGRSRWSSKWLRRVLALPGCSGSKEPMPLGVF
mmetsp:Transcript_92565/g.247555  ORF Transcript_92565/g.247555 Transcript_92565/m.247555 type:complete len:175 (-) Transcript_92565:89-613(-)